MRLHQIPDYPFTRPFERWLGFPLTPRQRTLVTILERQRATLGRVRLFLGSRRAPQPDIARTLTLYLRWLQERITPRTQALVIDRDRLSSWRLAREIPRATYAYGRRIDQARGRTFDQLLILNAHAFCPSRRPIDSFDDAVSYCFPVVPMTAGSVIIVYGSLYRRSSSFRYYYSHHTADLNSPFVTITEAFLDLTPKEALQIIWPRAPISRRQQSSPHHHDNALPDHLSAPSHHHDYALRIMPYALSESRVALAAAATAQAA